MYLFYVLCIFSTWCISGSDIDNQKPKIIDNHNYIETTKQRANLSKEEKIRNLISNLYDLEEKQIQAIDAIDDIDSMLDNQDDITISPTIEWLMNEDLDPNIQKDGNTLLHHLTTMTWGDNPIDCTAEIKRLFIYGANPYIKNRADDKSPFDLTPAEKRELLYGKWKNIKQDDIEQRHHSWKQLVAGSCKLPPFVRNHFDTVKICKQRLKTMTKTTTITIGSYF